MPYKSEKIPLGVYDRRIKLNDVQREEIKELRKKYREQAPKKLGNEFNKEL